MAGPSSPRKQLPQCDSTIFVKKSSSKPPLKTYSKRTLQEISEPPDKRQRIEHPTIPIQSTVQRGAQPSTPNLPKKRSISEYFKSVTHIRAHSSPQPSIFSSDPVKESTKSPPSSPPSPYTSLSAEQPKKRVRRRLTARPPLALIKMSDINAGSSKEHEKGENGLSALFDPESSACMSTLMNNPSIGLAEAGNVETSVQNEGDGGAELHRFGGNIARSDSNDNLIVRGHIRHLELEENYTPFEPGRPDTVVGHMFPPSLEAAALARERNFDSIDSVVERSVAHLQMASGSIGTLIADTSTGSPMDEGLRSDEDLAGRGMLLRRQEEDMLIYMSSDDDEAAIRPAIMATSGASTLAGNHSHAPGNLIDHGPIVPATNNLHQGPTNLVQTQLALNQTTVSTCSVCRFTWNRTIPADIMAHQDYHDVFTLGEPVIGLTTTGRHELLRINTGIGRGDYVVMVDRSSSQGWKNLALSVLEGRVDRELGALAIHPSVLWSRVPDPSATGSVHEATQVDRFKIYMYVRHYVPKLGRVVSLLLAERIKTGFETISVQVQEDEFGPWPSIVPLFEKVVTSRAHEAVLGVNKVWTIESNRRRGYAKTLLDVARDNFIPTYIIPRVHVAWTFTTGDGANFANNYLHREADYDYLTYNDQP